jgi:hypothetical protein
MNERYEDVRMAPDPTHSEELRRHLHAQLTGSASSRVVELDEEVVVSQNPIRHRSRGRVYLAAAAAVVIVGGVVGIALATDPDSNGDIDNAPVVTEPPVATPRTTPATTAPATNAPAVTTTFAPAAMSPDADIALAALLYPSEYARGATRVPVDPPTTTFDLEVASGIESCNPYLDAIAAADAAPEFTRVFGLFPDAQGQYTVVFPNEQIATSWFDVVTTDAFLGTCAIELFDAQYAVGEWLPVGPLDRNVAPLDLAGDDVSVGIARYDVTRSDAAPIHTESLQATVRVGRMAFTMDAVYPRLTTVESFEAMITRAVARAQAALDGEILPEKALPDSPALTDDEIAEASLLTDDDLTADFVVNESRTDVISLDAGAATTIIACGPYAETLATFADATERTRWFTSYDGANDDAQYTVVFPDEQAANRVFDMLNDDTFVAGCAIPMLAQQGSDVPVLGTTEGPVMSWLIGDESSLRVNGDGYFDYRIRVGRAVIVFTGADSGDQAQWQFQVVAERAAQKLRLALEGIVLPQ